MAVRSESNKPLRDCVRAFPRRSSTPSRVEYSSAQPEEAGERSLTGFPAAAAEECPPEDAASRPTCAQIRPFRASSKDPPACRRRCSRHRTKRPHSRKPKRAPQGGVEECDRPICRVHRPMEKGLFEGHRTRPAHWQDDSDLPRLSFAMTVNISPKLGVSPG